MSRTSLCKRVKTAVLLCAEHYSPSSYSNPDYRPQLAYPAPPMGISQPIAYPQHAVRPCTAVHEIHLNSNSGLMALIYGDFNHSAQSLLI